ncbi:MAG: CRISPR-associated endoribonuclease Cas6 [Oscillospiraceae bacterium]
MILNVQCTALKKQLPIDYRPAIVSLFKWVLSKEYPEYYEQTYLSNTLQKEFTFSVAMEKPIFSGDKVSFENENIKLQMSFAQPKDALIFYNSFIRNLNYAHPLADNNTLKVVSATLQNGVQITSDRVKIKFLSPLVVRAHNKGEDDRYYVFDDKEFEQGLNMVLSHQLKRPVQLSLTPINPKKTVVKSFKVNVRGTIGTFLLQGDRATLNYLLQAGMGSKRSQGFGQFTVVGGDNLG